MSLPRAQTGYGPFRWFVLLTLFIVTATTALALVSPAPLIGAIVDSPGQTLDAGEITWMTMGWFNLATACAALAGGYLVDRLGFVWVYAIGIALCLAGWLLVPAIGASYGGMMVIRLLQGLGTGPIMASSASVAANRFPVSERSIVTGTQGGAMAAGIGLGQIFMPKLLDATGDWESALFVLWPVPVAAMVLVAVVAFGPKPAEVRAEAVSTEETATTRHALRRALAQPTTWIIIACVALASWVYQAFNNLSPNYLTADEPVGIGMANGSALLGFAQVFNFIGSFAAGVATERMFRGRVRPGLVIGAAFGAVFGLAMLLPAATRSTALMLVVLSCASFFFAWVNPNAMGFIAKTYPGQITGKLGGYAMGIGIFGGTAGVAAGSAALHATGDYTMSIIIMSAACALGAVVALFVSERRKSGGPHPVPTLETAA